MTVRRRRVIAVSVAFAAVSITCGISIAQRRQPSGIGQRPSRNDDGLRLIQRRDIQNELGLTERQRQEIDQLALKQQSQIQQQYANLQKLPVHERRQAYALIGRGAPLQGMRDEISKILSSSQRSRLEQLEFRYHLERGSVAGALSSIGMSLDDEQSEKLDEIEQAVHARTRRRIAQIWREANTEILSSVLGQSVAQRLLGEDYGFDAPSESSVSPHTTRVVDQTRGREHIEGDDDQEQGASSRRGRRRRPR